MIMSCHGRILLRLQSHPWLNAVCRTPTEAQFPTDLPKCKSLPPSLAIPAVQAVWWSTIEEQYRDEIDAMEDVFGGEEGDKRRADLQLRVTEHNILVISKYYRRLRLARLAALLNLSEAEVNLKICGHNRVSDSASAVLFRARLRQR